MGDRRRRSTRRPRVLIQSARRPAAHVHATAGSDKKPEPIRNRGEKVGRNDPCPCGSGKKYKNCHMRQAV